MQNYRQTHSQLDLQEPKAHLRKSHTNVQGDSGFNAQILTTYSASKNNPSSLYKLYTGNASLRKFYKKKHNTDQN